MVSDHLVEEIRARADIVEVVGEFVSLKRTGKSYRGPCPLHGGEGPNFAVDPERQIFKCFVCGEGGDVFGFLMKHLGLDFPTAVRQVGARVGVEVPDREERRDDPHAPLRAVLAFAHEWYREQLRGPEGTRARAYLQGRGLGDEDAETYGLGYAPDEWRAFRAAALAHGIGDEVLLDLGLTARGQSGGEPYDRFRGRLTFAIYDLRDRPIGFGARILQTGTEAPKYLNSPESPIFHKGEALYGLNWARHEIRRQGRAAIVEGFTDVISLHRAGMRFAVAGLGTSFTREQAARLGRYSKRAYLLYDSDAAGLRATFRTGDILLAAGIHPLVVTLPRGADPDSLVRERGPGEMEALLEDAVDVLERKLQILRREGYLDRIEGRRRAVDGLLSTLRAVADPALRDIYLDRAEEGLGVRRDTLVHEIARARPRPHSAPARRRTAPPPPAPTPKEGRAEYELCLLLVRDPTLAREALRLGLAREHLSTPERRELFAFLCERMDGEGEPIDWSPLSPAAQAVVGALLEDDAELTEPGKVFQSAVRRLLFRDHRERLAEIDRELELADSEQQRRLLEEKQQLASELRAAGEAAAFMPGARTRLANADRSGTTPAGSPR